MRKGTGHQFTKQLTELGLVLVVAGLVSAPLAFGFGALLAGAGVALLGSVLVVSLLR